MKMTIRAIATAFAVLTISAFSFTSASNAQEMDTSLDRLKAMSDTIKSAKNYTFTAGMFFDEISGGVKIKRFGLYKVAVQQPNKLSWTVDFDDGSVRRGAFNGKEVVFAVPSLKTYTRVPFEGTIDDFLGFVTTDLGMSLPIANFLYQDIFETHSPNIIDAVNLGTRSVLGQTYDHIGVEGLATDWQIWISSGDVALPIRFVATYSRQLGDPELMVTFHKFELNSAKDSDFSLETPDDWVGIAIEAKDKN